MATVFLRRSISVWTGFGVCLLAGCSFDVPPESQMNPTGGQDLGVVADLPGSSTDMLTVQDMARRDLDQPEDMTPPVDFGEQEDLVSMPDMPSTEDLGQPEDMTPPVDLGMPDQGGPMYQICDGTRVDVQSNAAHCGQCNNACEGDCVDGSCACPVEGSALCGEDGRCTDVLYDPRNCGGCGEVCGTGEVCRQGSCECRPGLTLCNGACVDTTADPFNCGSCGNDCGENNRCKASQCGESIICGIGFTGCRENNRIACISDNVDQESDLYCRPGRRFDVLCGDACSGSEVCFEPDDLINPIQCRPYRPARSCDSCPCDECRDDEVCRRQILGIDDVTYCVRKP